MTLRLTGALMIILGCGGIGFSCSFFYNREIQGMREFIRMLDVIEAELDFRQTPLPALCTLASRHCEIYGKVLCAFSDALESQIAPNPGACMKVALARFHTLPENARTCLQAFGECMGLFDVKGQVLQLQTLKEQSRRLLGELEANKDLKLRTYRILGVCAGAALAILLV